MSASAGQIVRYRLPNQDDTSGDNFGLVVESSHTEFKDAQGNVLPDETRDDLLIAALDVSMIPNDGNVVPVDQMLNTAPPTPETTDVSVASSVTTPGAPPPPPPPTQTEQDQSEPPPPTQTEQDQSEVSA